MSIFYACAFWALFSILMVVIAEWIGDRRRYYRKDLEEIANSRYACRLLAEALEIEVPGEKAEQYISWAIKDRLMKEGASD